MCIRDSYKSDGDYSSNFNADCRTDCAYGPNCDCDCRADRDCGTYCDCDYSAYVRANRYGYTGSGADVHGACGVG